MINLRTALFCTVATIIFHAASASAEAPVIIIQNISESESSLDNSLSQSEIFRTLHPSSKTADISQMLVLQEKVGGTNTSNFTRTITIDANFGDEQVTNVHIRGATVRVGFTNMVLYVANDLDNCYKKDVAAHERQHVDFRLQTLKKHEEDIKMAVANALSDYDGKLVTKEGQEEFSDNIVVNVYAALDTELNNMWREISVLDAQIDNPEAYADAVKDCR